MAPLSGIRLTLPNGTVFRTTRNVSVDPQRETLWLFNGAQQGLAILEELGLSGQGNGTGDGIYLGAGAAVSRTEVRFTQHEGNTEQWGDSAADDSARSKRDELVNALERTRISSDNPATLEHSEFSTGGKFEPREVVVLQFQLPTDAREDTSSFSGTISFGNAGDIQSVLQGGERTP
ncbi:hypothetical protein [Haloarcula pelagica]|uniref:hypothetical protein n=1 Tax=Haloarcula pelagica TaxID=3033389 RepID=UPI0024C45D79|nr:hypothetical protein [Halomicroarcula sp. YJ-61-S]